MIKNVVFAAIAAVFMSICSTSSALAQIDSVESYQPQIVLENCRMEVFFAAMEDKQFHDNHDGFTLLSNQSRITLTMEHDNARFTVVIDPYTYQILEYFLFDEEIGYAVYRYHPTDPVTGNNSTFYFTRMMDTDPKQNQEDIMLYFSWYTDDCISTIKEYYWGKRR